MDFVEFVLSLVVVYSFFFLVGLIFIFFSELIDGHRMFTATQRGELEWVEHFYHKLNANNMCGLLDSVCLACISQSLDLNKDEIFTWLLNNISDKILNDLLMEFDELENFKSIISRINDIQKINFQNIFYERCKKGNKKFAEYLLSTYPKISIHANNHLAIRKSLKYGHTNLSKYLIKKSLVKKLF